MMIDTDNVIEEDTVTIENNNEPKRTIYDIIKETYDRNKVEENK